MVLALQTLTYTKGLSKKLLCLESMSNQFHIWNMKGSQHRLQERRLKQNFTSKLCSLGSVVVNLLSQDFTKIS